MCSSSELSISNSIPVIFPARFGWRALINGYSRSPVHHNKQNKAHHSKAYGWNEASCTEKLFLIHEWGCSQHGGSEGFLALDVHRWLQHRSGNLMMICCWKRMNHLRLLHYEDKSSVSGTCGRVTGAGTAITCWAFLTADEYLYWPLLGILGMSARPPTVWVPMLSETQTDSSTSTTERWHHGSGIYSSSGRSWWYWAPEWKLVGLRRWEWIHAWAQKQSCRGLKKTIVPCWEREPFPALVVVV